MQIFNNNTAESMHLKCKFAFDGAKISNRNLRRRRVLQAKKFHAVTATAATAARDALHTRWRRRAIAC
jgi:hypothetical protein